MSVNDLPGTVDAKQNPISAINAPQSTTAPETEVSAEATPGLDLRGYELMEHLGGGGMGDVYRAGDPSLGRDLAVKVMKAELQGYAAAEQRFLREARVTGSLQHPGIVPIYNLGRLADGRLHYTMRLVRGRTFSDILKDEAGQPKHLPALLTIFEKICQAVAYAHSKQVIHRDLKPANVMVGRFGEVQVLDWGLAKLLTAGERDCVSTPTEKAEVGTRIRIEAPDMPTELTRLGREMGTPAYMPPEQALGEWDTVDERADVFALGAILCEVLTGRPPYSSQDSTEALRKAKRVDLAAALERLASCGAEAALLVLCRDCLTPAREGRPRDAEQVAQRVAVYQAEVQERLRRAELERAAAMAKARAERKQRRLAIVFVLLLSTAAVIGGWLAVRANDAAQAERQAKLKAEKSETDTKAVLKYFQDKVLSAGRPKDQAGGLGKEVTLRQAVDKAEKDIADSFKDRPLVEASIRNTLGSTYLYLGEFTSAIQQFERSLALHEAQLGDDHPDTLSSRSNLAQGYKSAGRLDDAIRLHEQNLKLYEVQLGPDHPDTLTSRHNLAVAYRAANRLDDAIRLHKQTLQQREAKLGPDDPDTLHSRNGLASAYWSANHRDEAIPLFEQTLRQREAKLGADHPDTLISRNNLAEAYRVAGRVAEAIPLQEQTVKQMVATLGGDHPDTLAARHNLGAMHLSAGNIAEAIQIFEQTLPRREAKLGVRHPDTHQSRIDLADAYVAAGAFHKARPLFDKARPVLEPYLQLAATEYRQRLQEKGAKDLGTLLALRNMGQVLGDQGRFDEAEPLLWRVLAGLDDRKLEDPIVAYTERLIAAAGRRANRPATADWLRTWRAERKQGGDGAATTAKALEHFARQQLKQRKWNEAEMLLRCCLDLRQGKEADAWTTFNTRSLLGEALLDRKKYAEAEPLLLQGYNGMKERQQKIPPSVRELRLSEALERVVRLYEATGQTDKAADWRKKLQEAKAAQKTSKP